MCCRGTRVTGCQEYDFIRYLRAKVMYITEVCCDC